MSEDKFMQGENGNDYTNNEQDLEKDSLINEVPETQVTPPEAESDHTAPVEDIHISDSDDSNTEAIPVKKNGLNPYKIFRILCMIGFVVFAILFVNEVIIQPYRIKKSIEYTRELYNKPTKIPVTVGPTPTQAVNATVAPTPSVPPTPTPDPNRDAQGRLLQFKDLLAVNDDVKGWLTIPDTNIDYVVVQAADGNQEYYLDKDIKLDYSKAGTLFIDSHGSVENKSQNLVIHGHNMISTAEKMFHYLLKYSTTKNGNGALSYYQKHPLITFDTIYNTGEWKIFAVFITNGAATKRDSFFDYTRTDFKDTSDFLNFVYQIRNRSMLNIDSVDIKDTDQLLMLSTCSYEADNYRTVVVARKVRDGEDPSVDVDTVTKNINPLFPESYYYRYGGEAPQLPATFEEALKNGTISWYTPSDNTSN